MSDFCKVIECIMDFSSHVRVIADTVKTYQPEYIETFYSHFSINECVCFNIGRVLYNEFQTGPEAVELMNKIVPVLKAEKPTLWYLTVGMYDPEYSAKYSYKPKDMKQSSNFWFTMKTLCPEPVLSFENDVLDSYYDIIAAVLDISRRELKATAYYPELSSIDSNAAAAIKNFNSYIEDMRESAKKYPLELSGFGGTSQLHDNEPDSCYVSFGFDIKNPLSDRDSGKVTLKTEIYGDRGSVVKEISEIIPSVYKNSVFHYCKYIKIENVKNITGIKAYADNVIYSPSEEGIDLSEVIKVFDVNIEAGENLCRVSGRIFNRAKMNLKNVPVYIQLKRGEKIVGGTCITADFLPGASDVPFETELPLEINADNFESTAVLTNDCIER